MHRKWQTSKKPQKDNDKISSDKTKFIAFNSYLAIIYLLILNSVSDSNTIFFIVILPLSALYWLIINKSKWSPYSEKSKIISHGIFIASIILILYKKFLL